MTSFLELYETSHNFPIQGTSIQMSRRISQSRETRSFLESVSLSWRCLDDLCELDLLLLVLCPTTFNCPTFPQPFFHFVLRPHGAVRWRNLAIFAKFMAWPLWITSSLIWYNFGTLLAFRTGFVSANFIVIRSAE